MVSKPGKLIGGQFTYHLPAYAIAQRPVVPYDRAKLLLVSRETGELKEATFQTLSQCLRSSDILVFNNSRVIPARLHGTLDSGAELEVLLIEELQTRTWRCIGKPLKKMNVGGQIYFRGDLRGKIERRISDREISVRFEGQAELRSKIMAHGCMPIPPYIRGGMGDDQDFTDYQTCYAQIEGSIAAPTAGLHFTPELLEQLRAYGVQLRFVTLHLGMASIQPSSPGAERYIFDAELLAYLQHHRQAGGRIIAVGTSVVRALESMVCEQDAQAGAHTQATLCIQPGFSFRIIDALITNFHQPGSSHLLLVEAFMGYQLVEQSYRYALERDFRFLSYGDGMCIL